MIYSFACPVPCSREFKVDAHDNGDAVSKIIMAGAMGCRNIAKLCSCEQAQFAMPPVTEEELRNIVFLCMREEREADETIN